MRPCSSATSSPRCSFKRSISREASRSYERIGPSSPPVSSRSGIQTNILTNGLETEPETVALMKEVGITAVGMSLDGLAPTHDYIRRRAGSYEAVLKSVELFQKHQVPLNIITTVNASNINELEPLFHVLKERGVEYWRLQPTIATGRVKDHTDLQATADVILAIGRFVREHQRIGNGNGPAIICADGLEYITEVPGQRPWRGCSAGIAACGIRSDGKVTGCLSMPEEIVEGDLRKDDLWNIWFREDAFPYSRHFSEGKLGPNCTGCEKAEECLGGCSSNSYAATGRFHNDPYCFRKISQV